MWGPTNVRVSRRSSKMQPTSDNPSWNKSNNIGNISFPHYFLFTLLNFLWVSVWQLLLTCPGVQILSSHSSLRTSRSKKSMSKKSSMKSYMTHGGQAPQISVQDADCFKYWFLTKYTSVINNKLTYQSSHSPLWSLWLGAYLQQTNTFQLLPVAH